MKTWSLVLLMLALAVIATPAFAAQSAQTSANVPKYDPATESVFKGEVQEVSERVCAVSHGLGSHVMLKLEDGSTIEVHLATVKFVKLYDLAFAKGDKLEVTGSKVKFEGVDTIFAREVKRGNDVFLFRDKEGKPVW